MARTTANEFVNEPTERECRLLLARLSDRQRDVLRLTMTGVGRKQIADELNLTESTVKVYRERIFSRLGVTCSAHAAFIAGRGNLI